MNKIITALSTVSWKILWAAILGLVALVGFQTWRLQAKTTEVGVQSERAISAMRAAENNAEEAIYLSQLLDQCVENNRLVREAERLATDQLEQTIDRINRIETQSRLNAERIYEQNPECSEWRDAAVCDDIAGELRSARSAYDQDDRGAGGDESQSADQESEPDTGS